jgi:hypothetical protein
LNEKRHHQCQAGEKFYNRLLLARLPRECTGIISVGEARFPGAEAKRALHLSGKSVVGGAECAWSMIVVQMDRKTDGDVPLLPLEDKP